MKIINSLENKVKETGVVSKNAEPVGKTTKKAVGKKVRDKSHISEEAREEVKTSRKVKPIELNFDMKTAKKASSAVEIHVNKIDLEHQGIGTMKEIASGVTEHLHGNYLEEAMVKLQERASDTEGGKKVYLPAIKQGLTRRLGQINFKEAADRLRGLSPKTIYFIPVRKEVDEAGKPSLKRTGEKPVKIGKHRDFIDLYKNITGGSKVNDLVNDSGKLDKQLAKPVPVIDDL